MRLPVRVRNMGGYENILRQQIENIPTTLSAYVYIYRERERERKTSLEALLFSKCLLGDMKRKVKKLLIQSLGDY